MGIFNTDDKPDDGFSPKPMDLQTREKERRTEKVGWRISRQCNTIECAKDASRLKRDELDHTDKIPRNCQGNIDPYYFLTIPGDGNLFSKDVTFLTAP